MSLQIYYILSAFSYLRTEIYPPKSPVAPVRNIVFPLKKLTMFDAIVCKTQRLIDVQDI